jgi:hypothetical protein
MNAHHLETTLEKDGTLVLEGLPFHAGDSVEVIIVTRSSKSASGNRYPLQGTPVIYENPTEPVALEDWETLKRLF